MAAWPVLGVLIARWRFLRSRLHAYTAQAFGAAPAAGGVQTALVGAAAAVVLVAALVLAPSSSDDGGAATSDTQTAAPTLPSAEIATLPSGGEPRASGHRGRDGASGETSVRADIGDVADDDPPATGAVSLRLERDESRWRVEDDNEGSAGDDETGGGGQTWVECESGSQTARTACEVLDTLAEHGV